MSEKPTNNLDNVFEKIGGLGRYQLLMGVIELFAINTICANQIFFSFGALKPTFACKLENGTELTDICKIRAQIQKNLTTGENCSNVTQNCTYVTADESCTNVMTDRYFYSVVDEWDLFCHRDYIPNLLITIFSVGMAVGYFAGGPLADYYGRKWNTIIMLAGQIVIGIVAAFSVSWQMFAGLIFLL